jgi:Peptidase inhibitor family I36
MLSLRRLGLYPLIALAIPVALLTGGPASAAAGQPTAVLDGRSIAVSQVSRFHCHDLTYPIITCFTSANARDADVARLKASSAGVVAARPASATSSGYVIAYQFATYAGASVVLTQNYPNLATIGWNDTISSYKVFTSYTGAFYTNTTYTGLYQSYCCYSLVPYVGDAYDNSFSSFSLP